MTDLPPGFEPPPESPGGAAPAPVPAKKPSKPLLIVLGIFGCFGLMVGSCVVLALLFVLLTEDLPVEEADRAVLVRAVDLVPYLDGFETVDGAESIQKIEYLDGSRELTLEYDVPEDDEQPYLQVTVSRENSRTDAEATYELAWSATLLGMKIAEEGVEVEEDNEVFSIGDRSPFGFILHDGERAGIILVFREGKVVYELILAPFSIADPVVLHELLDEKVPRLRKWR